MTSAPTGRTTRRAALTAPVLLGAAGLAAAALLRLRDPHVSGSYGFCPFQALAGVPCPGCGGLRAVNDLTRGEVVAAVSSNALAVALVGTLAVLWGVWLVRRARGQHDAAFARVGLRPAVRVLVLVAVFGIVRTTPWGSWLAP
jgi:hypothetical protein